jgi:methyl-accepting chemotaxis protein
VQQVAAASREQSSGVDQMKAAMGAMDQVTQRNASSAEELSAAAEQMRGEAVSLQRLVAFFAAEGAPAEPLRRPRGAPPARESLVA